MKSSLLSKSIATVLSLFLSGCATIMSGTTDKIEITSNPTGAKFTIFDKKGKAVESRMTPASVLLSRTKSDYKIKFESPDYYSDEGLIRSHMNGWYIGNVVFGGPLGLLLFDPASGAMWDFDESVEFNLIPLTPELSPTALAEKQMMANSLKRTNAQSKEIIRKMTKEGKSDGEISIAMHISVEEVRHIRNPLKD